MKILKFYDITIIENKERGLKMDEVYLAWSIDVNNKMALWGVYAFEEDAWDLLNSLELEERFLTCGVKRFVIR